ncbi:MAG: hypothetical protein A3G20_03480 [Acidobacteria bacterium RIFCSPLOWO2_12_FULL_59_11]|nr:MAG: hypothetical protein A3G20_03480 [Acidobacteria bacterium RIFCSPLOWO2_12_FULL_59_11]
MPPPPTRDINAHGPAFFAQLEMLLKRGAPISVGAGEAPLHRILKGAVPHRFPLCRKAIERLETRRRKALGKKPGTSIQELTPDMIIGEFEDAAMETTWKIALLVLGGEHGLIDISENATSPWAASVLKKAHAAFRRMRRFYLLDKKTKRTWERQVT